MDVGERAMRHDRVADRICGHAAANDRRRRGDDRPVHRTGLPHEAETYSNSGLLVGLVGEDSRPLGQDVSIEASVIETVQSLLARYGRSVPVTASSRLYADGLGLDSLGAAELSTMLEMAFGRDPYSEGLVPRTVAEIVRYYDPPAGPR